MGGVLTIFKMSVVDFHLIACPLGPKIVPIPIFLVREPIRGDQVLYIEGTHGHPWRKMNCL